MRLAKNVFRLAGFYGVIVLAPQYFMETRISTDAPPAITHPEYFYGFIGLALVFQFLFFVISTDPIRYRPLMLIAVLEKLVFLIPVAILFVLGRTSSQVLGFSLIDGLIGALFLIAFMKTRSSRALA